MVLGIFLSLVLFFIGCILSMQTRSAYDVCADLLETYDDVPSASLPHSRIHRALPFIVGGLFALWSTWMWSGNIQKVIPLAVIGIAGSYIVQSRLEKRRHNRIIEEIEYSLPLFMERMVMAAEAGLDVIPALKAVVEFDETKDSKHKNSLTSIATLLRRVITLTEQGVSFERALDEVSRTTASRSFHHACIHLNIAFKEGGELIGPLRELSDSTQLLYQETVEEEIAKLPVKATLPLVMTFGGLVLCILAMPLVQILSFTGTLVTQGGK